jgi:hypothetical protein
MTGRLAIALATAVAATAAFWVPAGGSQPGDPGHTGPITRAVLVGIDGKGTVTSVPRGISCPKTCFTRFHRDILLRLVAKPAPGWKLVGWTGTFCHGTNCAFHLTTPHDCSGQLCSLGVFGTRVRFARLQP